VTWLLCDYGEVLSLPQSADDRGGLEEAGGGGGSRFWDDYWAHRPGYDRADLSAVDYWAAVLGHTLDHDLLERLIALDVASWLRPNPRSLAAAGRAAARGLRLAILSNAPVDVADAADTQDWLQPFAPRIFSSRLRAIKPEPAAYVAALAALNAEPQEVVFVDDRPGNVIAARSLGLRAVVFEHPDQFDALDP
jgi:putative hydrolase of the HAD superfamily